jgi:hypothetical protein
MLHRIITLNLLEILTINTGEPQNSIYSGFQSMAPRPRRSTNHRFTETFSLMECFAGFMV